MRTEGGTRSERPARGRAEAGFHGVVAVDGPSGSGKSTVSRRLADRLGAAYLDTGAMYRAITWAVLTAGVPPVDVDRVAALVPDVDLRITTDPHRVEVHVDGIPVDDEIRGPEVTAAVSAVSGVPQVRSTLIAEQRRIIAGARGTTGIVVEGRDIGEVVAPDADLKVFLTADPGVRAQRRTQQVGDRDVAATEADLNRRDTADAKVTSPLAPAPGAVPLDTTELGIDEVVGRLCEMLPEGTR